MNRKTFFITVLVVFYAVTYSTANKNENVKRQPCGGIRERKEVRQMSRFEWKRFTNALNSLKRKGKFGVLAQIHRGKQRLAAAYGGPNFLGFHRMQLLTLENLLRREDPCVTLPYWDSTLDVAMEDPKKSIMWSPEFFGNGDYEVTSGPFESWRTQSGHHLIRNIGHSGTLVTRDLVQKIFDMTHHRDILHSDGPNPGGYIEALFNATLKWVGGNLRLLGEAPEDPVYYLHASFIDCIWLWFQEQLWKRTHIESEHDYPNVTGPHDPNMKLYPFSRFQEFADITNRDGYSRKYSKIYTCRKMTHCSVMTYECDSRQTLVYCNAKDLKCISYEMPEYNPKDKSPPAIGKGPTFHSYLSDPRAIGRKLKQTLPDANLEAKPTSTIIQELGV